MISIVISFIIYGALFFGVKSFNVFSSKISVQNVHDVPAEHRYGSISYINLRAPYSRLSLRQDNGEITSFECYGVDYQKFPNAIPCGQLADSFFKGRKGRVWYVSQEVKGPFSFIGGKGSRQLAVQIKMDDGTLFPFSVERQALLEFEGKKDGLSVVFTLSINALLMFVVWVFVFHVVEKFFLGK